MWSTLGRRAIDFAVGFFALLGFVVVPLGERTAWQHATAVFTTGAAREAGRSLIDSATRLRARMFDSPALEPAGPHPRPAPAPAGSGPTPEPPPLARPETGDAGADASVSWP